MMGAVMASAGPRRRLGPAALAMLLVAVNFPDADILLSLAGQDAYVFHHRGISHSLPGTFLSSLFLAYVFQRLAPSIKFLPYFLLAWVGQLSNVALDLTNAWGTMLLWPFQGGWRHLGWTAIMDPWIWGILATGLVLSMLRPRSAVWTSWTTLVVLAGYCILCGAGSMLAKRHFGDALGRIRVRPVRVEGFPQLFEPMTWNVVGFLPDRYYLAKIHALDGLKGRVRMFMRQNLPENLKGPFSAEYERWATAPMARPYADADSWALLDLRFYGRPEGMPFVAKLYRDTTGLTAHSWLPWRISQPVAEQEYEITAGR
jgi:membrane-bound metal-dependent hydrolase YbcI (DUF457 family)